MRTEKRNLMCVLSAMVLMAVNASATELLMNPGFEDPVVKYDKQGWDCRGPQNINLEQITDPVVEGKYALLVDGRGKAQWEGVKQVVKLEVGKTYRLSGSIRLGKGEKPDRGAIQLLKSYKDGSKGYQDIFRSKLRADAYTEFSELFSVEEDNIVEMAISIHGMKDGRSFIVDNFSLMEVD